MRPKMGLKIKRHCFLLMVMFTLLRTTVTANAQTAKVITLKDGSIIKGKVVRLVNGIYTLETSNLGQINVPESTILSIVLPRVMNSQNQQAIGSTALQKEQLKNQVQQMQGSILSDPELMGDLQDMVKDKEIQAMLSDPKLLSAILSYDPEKLQNNQNVQRLMQNPKIQNLMNKVYQKMPTQK